jgi:diguanylate cyclase (GGDEF)-like protein
MPIEDTASPIKDMLGTTVGCVLVFRDFSERREKQRHIEYLSYHDQLTGLYNRRYFEEELKRQYVEKNLPFSIIYADINGLKLINDVFGHENGDKIIQLVAELFMTESNPGNIVTRIGGDEFVILLSKTDETEVEELSMRILKKTEKMKFMDIYVSVSLGWDTGRDPSKYASDILKNAEDFMYQKKVLNSTNKRNELIKSIYSSLLQKCPGEKAHFTRVSNLCEKIGRAYDLSGHDIKELIAAGELHDIGKIVIDEAILNKTRNLSESELSQMKHHPEIGFRLLGATSEYVNVAEYVHSHHERWDGAGYPRGLKGEEISWKARVVAIADAYDAMTFGRPYRDAISPEEAVKDMKQNAGTQFDPDIVKVFIEKVLGLEW